VVTNARTPGARCYGYVTMATSEDATKCIQHLHRTELHGRMISVERVRTGSWEACCSCLSNVVGSWVRSAHVTNKYANMEVILQILFAKYFRFVRSDY
jgi:RNA recognition motif-containing protein